MNALQKLHVESVEGRGGCWNISSAERKVLSVGWMGLAHLDWEEPNEAGRPAGMN